MECLKLVCMKIIPEVMSTFTVHERQLHMKENRHCSRISEVLTAAKISMVVFWAVTLCGLVGGYQNF
jgi:hypothetical protein